MRGKRPRCGVSVALLGGHVGADLVLGARFYEIQEVAARRVPGEVIDSPRRTEEYDRGDDKRQAPRRTLVGAPCLGSFAHQRHEDLDDATASVSPPATMMKK